MIAFLAEERFTHTVIVGRFRAILFQALCLTLNCVCLVGALCQTNPVVNSAEEKSYHPPFWMLPGQEQNENPEPSAVELARLLKEAEELWIKGDAAQGIPKFESLLPQIERAVGKDSPTVGLVLFRIGFLYSMRGDHERAVSNLERSLRIVSPLPDNAENLVTKANLYWGLGMGYKSLLQDERAIQAFNESLKFKEKLVGPDDSSLVGLLSQIGDLYSLQGRQIDAIPLFERALAISEKKFGAESAEAANSLALLGNTKAQIGQFEPALAYLKRSLQIREKIFPPSKPGARVRNVQSGNHVRSGWRLRASDASA